MNENDKNKDIIIEILESAILRYIMLFTLDVILTFISFFIAYQLRFEGKVPENEAINLIKLFPFLVSSRIITLFFFQLHRWSFRYAGFHDGIRVIIGMAIGTFLFLSSVILFHLPYPPRSVVALEFFISSIFLGGYRFLPRLLNYFQIELERSRGKNIRRTLIIGAGSAGELLLRDLRRSEEHPYKVIGFIDDDPQKVGKIISGQKVLGNISKIPEIAKKQKITDILIAIPKLEPKKVKEILDMCQNLKLRYKILPVSFSYVQDSVSASMLQELQPEDLLPRESVPFKEEEIEELVRGRRTLVTGGAGSIGSEIARQLAKYGAKTIVLVDINENDLYFLYRDLKEKYPNLDLYPEVADIRDREKMFQLGRKYKPQDILHAAAHKHVPLMEIAPEEAVKNNIFGTENVADMALECGAEKFVFISTDKAVNPTSVMGVTKRIGEFIVREKAKLGKTHFCAVRFGNVLGSAGSVVPLFKKQIAKGGPVTVTHPEIKRYFMTIEEAVGLVILAGLGKYGELCILDMGEQIKIVDLARHMITMAGLVPEQDIKIVFSGLRPGEKLHEDLMTEQEENTQEVRAKILIAKS
ncbi:MAG: polysaccharide biosynthesis protein, partial [Acidobacteria bacterium]|nr:polysaccharide biosynthesis protein [Acidobacteriota bacterium]